jgi:acyl carrier protein
MSNEYLKEIKKIIEDKIGTDPADITPESFFEDDLNVGEMELIEILTELEDKYHVELMEDRDNIETVQDLIDMLTEQVE